MTTTDQQQHDAIDAAISGVIQAMWGDDQEACANDPEGRRDLATVLWALGWDGMATDLDEAIDDAMAD